MQMSTRSGPFMPTRRSVSSSSETPTWFVHQILTRTRVQAEAMTSFSMRINTFHDAWLGIHMRYVDLFLWRRAL
jgi:hypothetical protein